MIPNETGSMNILLIEDDLRIAGFIEKGLGELGYSTRHAPDGVSGLDLAINESFDLGIFDLMLPGIDGLSILERMRASKSRIPVIILSARRSIDDRVKGLHLGGDDYLTKPFSFSELAARVQALLRRASSVRNEVNGMITVEDLSINLFTRDVFRDDKRILLQPREFALLEFLARRQGHVVTKSMIIDRVWNYSFDPRTNVVEARISKLREKVDRGFSFPLIHTVRGLGYVLRRQDDTAG